MRPTDSTRALPRWLLVLLVLLLAGRVGFGLWERAHPLPKPPVPTAQQLPGKPLRGGPDLVEWAEFERGLAAAQVTGQPVLYDYSAEWCGPCHRMSDEVFADRAIARELNATFVPVRLVDRRQEDGANPAVVDSMQEAHTITAFPTLVATTADGRELGRVEGYPGKQAILDSLRVFAARGGVSTTGATIRLGM